MTRAAAGALLALAALPAAAPDRRDVAAAPARSAVVWTIDNLAQIGGHAVAVVGAPRVVETGAGRAVAFDGVRDGLVIDANPLAGLSRFTLEIVFEPALDGGEEQRFLHVEEGGTGNRALIELRLEASAWRLDTYLRHGDTGLTLFDRATPHRAGQWWTAALTFDGKTMAHFVNGRKEQQGAVPFKPLGAGKTSLGMRQNLVSFFKGRISLVRTTPDVLAPAAMLGPPR